MFIGHYAPALLAATHPKAPGLGTLFVAGQLVDFGFFGLAITGIENFRITPGITVMNPLDLYDMPYTHSLLGSSLWALGFALIIWLFTRHRMAAIIGGAVVLSHWFLDWLVHAPDLTWAGAPPMLGFGLWNYPAIEMPLEFLITFGALAFYLIKTRAMTEKAKYAVAGMIALLAIYQAFDWFAPKPVEVDLSLPISALVSCTLAAIVAWWLAKTRTLKKA